MPTIPSYPKREQALGIFAGFMWFVAWVVISILVWRAPMSHSDCGVYATAAQDWWAGRGVYLHNFGIDGFLYLPQFALAYTPFALMGHPAGDLGWRALGLGLFATGVWRMTRILSPSRHLLVFALATAATLPPAMASLRNGQANLHIAGLMLQTAAELSRGRWWPAVFWLLAGVVIKPIIIAMVLLSAVVYRPLIWRLALGIPFILLFPFAFQKTDYVIAQYHAYAQVLNVSSAPPDLYCNIRGLLGKMGWVMSRWIFNAIALTAAAATLGLCLLARRRWMEPLRAFFLLGFAACFLMLFNPRTESNSYVMLAPVIALPASIFICVVDRPRASTFLYVLSFMLVCDGWAYHQTENWLKPLTCLIVWALLIFAMLSHPEEESLAPERELHRAFVTAGQARVESQLAGK
ncbi:MAG: DUF2029 domain-containing protein [Planctomycetota bacterium]|nr:DUF2029 domain-containing protein [Planctomycetota bacterium]